MSGLLPSLSRAAISHDPAQRAGGASSQLHGGNRARISVTADGRRPSRGNAERYDARRDAWLELLVDGLTFDLLGLAPGPALDTPAISHLFSVPTDLDLGAMDAIGLFPGPHLCGGANSLPVVRTMLALASDMAEALGAVRAVVWSPASSAIAPAFFRKIVASWLRGGPFPAMGVVSYAVDGEGGLQSEGLAFFNGQELALSPALSDDRIAATRLAARLVHELVASGAITEDTVFATEDGGQIMLSPDTAGRTIRVTGM
ncbi:hypothetical protein [Qipengyuania marisflavi]|uniref:Uncharacterized protein n=1 Tax=Qipengyuania marisflavi TaxID=2486356 RepID=A0A5S3P8N5_9SPHN|nr:hypothetical protein [Qipengyuania marisflavi]TMM49786.1 hypothetical protein FEV51_00880 [Qipengyuania marisflavi]